MATPGPNKGFSLGTPRYEWKQFRAFATEDSAAKLATATDDILFSNYIKSPDHVDRTDGLIDALAWGPAANALDVAFYGDGDDGDTAGFQIFAYRTGPSTSVGTLVCSTETGLLRGLRDLDADPIGGATLTGGFWMDSLTLAVDNWGCTVNGSGNDDIVQLSFDTRGYRFFQLNVHLVSAAGTEVTNLGAIVSGY